MSVDNSVLLMDNKLRFSTKREALIATSWRASLAPGNIKIKIDYLNVVNTQRGCCDATACAHSNGMATFETGKRCTVPDCRRSTSTALSWIYTA
jgi:hypothetical protein